MNFLFMSIRVFFFALLFGLNWFGCLNSLKAQPKIEKGSLQWTQINIYDPVLNTSKPVLFFDNGILKQNFPIAYVENKIALEQNQTLPKIYFTNTAFEVVPETDIAVLKNISDIKDSITIQTSLQIENKQKYLVYSFLPIRKNRISGNYERLTNYVLEYKESSSFANSQSMQVKSYAENSVLQSGDWYSFKVSKSGVYQITYNELKDLGLKNPELVKIYGNGGSMLPEKNTGTETDDIKEIPVLMVTGSDGIFNAGDYILFYAQGPVVWNWDASKGIFNYTQHAFTDEINYFITSGTSGKKITVADIPSGTPNQQVTTYDHYDFVENNLFSLIKSGREFYGDRFNVQTSYDFSFDLSNLVSGESVNIQSEVLSRSELITSYQFIYNNATFATAELPATNIYNNLAQYASVKTVQNSFTASAGKIKITLKYLNNGDLSAIGWLNYIKIWTRQNLKSSGSQLEFRDTRSVGSGNVTNFTIDGATNQMLVWDITDINNVKQYSTTLQNSKLSFTASSETLHNYIVFDYKTSYIKPTLSSENKISNQNLHSLKDIDFLIVTHPLFLDQANELADLHRDKDGLSVSVVTSNEIYNEFSSGNPDVASIRNFAKMLYDKASSPKKRLKYLLLFGDGSYDRKSTSESNTNYVLTYQSSNSLVTTESYVSDDYFGLLDSMESIESGLLDIGVGRFPVQDTATAEGIINKIKNYYSYKSYGDWRNMLCFIADDEDNNIHMEQADQLARYVTQNYPNFNLDKIYLDAFEQVSTTSGQQYPDVNTAIYNRLNQGALIMNYTGHGSESGLAAELIVKQKDIINNWNNSILPVFVTATCEFSRFDDYSKQTAGEDILLKSNGGGIALLSTTRLVYSGPNFVLNYQFYKNAFLKDSLGKSLALGEIMRKTKNATGSDINKLNFTLLGDPALILPYPVNTVQTDSINGKTIITSDTIRAFQKVRISGSIKNNSGSIINAFNGTIYPVVFDKTEKITTLANDNGTPFNFSQQKNILFKGQATVKNGYFKFDFIIPRDIDYNYDFGKVSYYAKDSSIDASGNFSKIVIGGLNTSNLTDSQGPIVKMYMNDTTFINGGITDKFPTLLAKVYDLNGINIGGHGIGHDLVATLDNNTDDVYILNNYYQTDIDNFQKGEVEFKMPEVTPGLHTLSLKVWDIFNNSTTAELSFRVLDEKTPNFGKVYCYPNPVNSSLQKTSFVFEHNKSDQSLEITIDIYNMTGKPVAKLQTTIQTTGFTSGPIEWDGTGSGGQLVPKGIYIYKITMYTKDGIAQSDAKKLIIIQ
jgi:hypothetical protein